MITAADPRIEDILTASAIAQTDLERRIRVFNRDLKGGQPRHIARMEYDVRRVADALIHEIESGNPTEIADFIADHMIDMQLFKERGDHPSELANNKAQARVALECFTKALGIEHQVLEAFRVLSNKAPETKSKSR